MIKNKMFISVVRNPFVIAFVIAFVIFAVYFLTPINLGSKISKSSHVTINYVDMSYKNDGPVHEISEFSFSSDSKEFQEIVELLQKYSYHHSLQSLYNNTNLKGSTQTFSIAFSSNAIAGKINYLDIGNIPKIRVDNSICRIGYFGSSTIMKLHSELKMILNIE